MHITIMNHHEPAYGRQLNERMLEAFGFSFEPWFERGQWTERYESCSVMDGGRMLANVGVYRMGMVLDGARHDALQVGAVATAADARGKGHQRRIFEHIFLQNPTVPAFLHANKTVTQFYPRFGFQRVWEWVPSLETRIDNDTAPVMASMDDPAFAEALRGRGPLSRTLDCADTEPVQWFHLIFDYGAHIYDLRDLDAYVLATQTDDKLFLADIISPRPVSFAALTPRLPFHGIRHVEFGFTPDLLDVTPDWTRIDSDDEALFVRGDMPLPARFRMPVTSLT